MKLEHVAIWATDLERMRGFYEVLRRALEPEIRERAEAVHLSQEFLGDAHVGVEVGSRAAVDALTARLQADGFALLDGPRQTGDGYYESIVIVE